MAGNAHLAREAVSHGQEVGLLPGGEADSQEPQSLLPGHDEPLPPPGFILLLLFGVEGQRGRNTESTFFNV